LRGFSPGELAAVRDGWRGENGTPLPPGHPHPDATRGRSQLASSVMREVRIRDTLSGELQTLPPDKEVGIYACGPTVYSRIHIGNARPFVIFMLLVKFLKSEGYDAKLVVNVTDINDKIYDAAKAASEPSEEFAKRMTAAYFKDTEDLMLGRPDAEPLATETINEIVDLISELVDLGHAYESGGDVYFRVSSFGDYGKLSNRRTEDMDQGEEAGSASRKESPLDFALWKAHKKGEDTSWESPWGSGRPGWHIECSAMAEAELGPSFAIHGGGSDLVFPHHENEIAQSEAAARPFARLWMHNGMVETDAEKMSKSEGNIFQLSEALERYGREAVVAFLISGHYRQPLAFGPEQMEQALARVERLRNFFREHPVGEAGGASPEQRREGSIETRPASRIDAFREALADDFNTPKAMAEIAELVAEANREEVRGAPEAVAQMLELLGLGSLTREKVQKIQVGMATETDVALPISAKKTPSPEALLAEREEARAARDFERADAIRSKLAEMGYEVRDLADGAKLVPKG
jgi:cysteinyl-tRNA synthetase